MKKILLLTVFLMSVFFIFAEEITLKNGEKVKGKITATDETGITVETSYGKIIIDREKVQSINYDDTKSAVREDEKKDVKKDEKAETDKEEEKSEDKNTFEASDNFMYKRYKSLLDTGVGLVIPGAICTFAPIIFFTFPIAMAFKYWGVTPMFDNPVFVFGFSWYVGVISIGVLLDAAAIICFALAGKTYQDWFKQKKISRLDVLAGYYGRNTVLGLTIKL